MLLFLVGISGAIDHLWHQPFLGIVLDSLHRLAIARVAFFEGHELVADLGVAVRRPWHWERRRYGPARA